VLTSLRKLTVFMRPFLPRIALAAFLTGVLTIIGMAPPLLMRRLLNDVAKSGRWEIFPYVMGLLFLVPVLRMLISFATNVTLRHVGLGIIASTRKRVYDQLMRLSLRFYNEMPVGGITQRLMGDVGTISNVTTGGIITLLADTVAVVFAVVVMLRLNVALSLLSFALLPLYYLNFRLFSSRIKDANTVVRSQMDHISSLLQERLSAHQLIQSYGQEKSETTHFSSQAKQIMDSAVRGAAYSATYNHVSGFVNKLGNTLVYSAGCYYFVKGTMDYGDVVAFCAYVTQILGPVVRFSNVANQIVQAGVAIERVEEILNRDPAIVDHPTAEGITELQGSIRVDGLGFNYEDETALTDVSLEIPAGAHVAITGPSGAGRTTLAMLLRRFYDPAEGKVEVDGRDIREYRLKDYRQGLSLVLPESVIFDGTIRENLLYGKPDAPEETMLDISKALTLHDSVVELRDGYETRLGSGGLRLSTGNQQKIGIARALISDPFILIVDEATANMDPETAESVNAAIRRAMEGRTCIMIVHRLLMARDTDEVVVMNEGSVVQEGEHDALLQDADGLYRSLFAAQYGDDRLPTPDEPDE
jgi:ATP-binding cassette, subfamily B, bacterial MsbA